MTTRMLVIPGSTRTEALSKRLARAAVQQLPDDAIATLFDLRDHPMPLYDGDLEQAEGVPEGGVALREALQAHDAVVFASPEYNSSIPAVLKNAIDWASRPHGDEGNAWAGKVCGLLASSPGALGGLRGLVHLRQIAMNVGMQVVTEQFALGRASEAFADDGSLSDERNRKGVQKVLDSVLRLTRALNPS